MPEIFECEQCGSTSFEELNTNQIKCSYCGTIYKKHSGEPAVVIGKGANVVVGKKGNVEIKGGLEIQSGANFDVQGQVVVNDRKKKKGGE